MIDTKTLLNGYKIDKNSLDDIIDELMLDKEINEFVTSNDIKPEVLMNSINTLLEFRDDTITNEKGKRESKSVKGYKLTLRYENGIIKSSYKSLYPKSKKNEKIKVVNLPNEILDASLEDFSLTSEERKSVYHYARRFINNFKTENEIKGLYISGKFKCGKTYLSAAIANEIAQKGYNVIMCYYPELSSILKDSTKINSEYSYLDIVEELKTVDLLILDDFGGDSLNTNIRDEALGVILQYRMTKSKPIILTSNINLSKIVDVCLRKDGSESERIKALRIYERINELTEEFQLTERYNEISF